MNIDTDRLHPLLVVLGLPLLWATWFGVWLVLTAHQYLLEVCHPYQDFLPPPGSKGG